jgi:hypothetical protein
MDAVVAVESLPRDLKLRGAGRSGVQGGNLRLEDGDKKELESEAEEGGPVVLVLNNESGSDIKMISDFHAVLLYVTETSNEAQVVSYLLS